MKHIFATLVALVCLYAAQAEVPIIKGVAKFTPKNANTLWYRTSAMATGVANPWMEYALPLGNGELGCMVYGGVHIEELQFNEKTLWNGPANTIGAKSGNRTYMNFGSLLITNNDKAIWQEVRDYVRYLDIEEGIAGVEFCNANGTKQLRRYFASAPDQLIAGHYTSEGEDKLELHFALKPFEELGVESVQYHNGSARYHGSLTAVNLAAHLHIVADKEAQVITSEHGITVSNATEITFYLKASTNFNGDVDDIDNYFTTESSEDVGRRIEDDINRASAKDFLSIEAAHIADFTALTKRMTFDLGLATPTIDTKELVDSYFPNNPDGRSVKNDHLFLEQLYFHYGRYLAISSNRRPIAAPNNLQGIWNNTGAKSPWNSDIHTNINIQMNYWPMESTNLSELHLPLINYIVRGAQSKGWREVAKRYNEGFGWSVLTETSLYNSMSTWGSNYLVANVWYTSHLWNHYLYTQDKEFLKRVLPTMWSCAEFWFHRLIKDRTVKDGSYVAPNEYSAEQPLKAEDGTAHAQQMITNLLQNINDAITILGREESGISKSEYRLLRHYLSKIDKGLHTEVYDGAWGDNFNGVSRGDIMLREWKYSPYTAGAKEHRHLSHLMALYPMNQISPESKYFEPAINALKLRGDKASGWSMGWKVNLWARTHDGDHAHLIIKNALKHSTSYAKKWRQGGIYYNLLDSHAPFQIDGNFGVCSGIAEMLMQSAHGYIDILPALPTAWREQGKVTGMKAVGNFTVDFDWKNGECCNIRLISNAGAPLRLRCSNIANSIVTVNGKRVKVKIDNYSIATIPCAKGDAIVVECVQRR